MKEFNAFVGLDVHKKRISVAVAEAERGGEVLSLGSIANTVEALNQLVRRLTDRFAEVKFVQEDARRISLKLGPKWSRINDGASLIPKGPLGDEVFRSAIYRYAETVIKGDSARYAALTDIMKKSPPRLRGQAPGTPIIPDSADLVAGSVAALKRLDNRYMLIQGPPGAGKPIPLRTLWSRFSWKASGSAWHPIHTRPSTIS